LARTCEHDGVTDGRRSLAKGIVLGIAVVAGAAAVLGVALAHLEGNSRYNQVKVALISLPFWAWACYRVWRAVYQSVLVGIIGAALAVAAALVVLADPSLRDDGMGSLVYVGMPFVVVLILVTCYRGPKEVHRLPPGAHGGSGASW
jgi:ABC-type Fe3+ transport system permease subunit